MKPLKLFFLFISVLLFFNCSDNDDQIVEGDPIVSDKIYEGDVELNTQLEVDNFGAKNYTDIEGELWIISNGGFETISDLSPLSALKSVRDILKIKLNPKLKNLNGLHNLESVGYLRLYDNPELSDISALSNLSFIGRGIGVDNNDALTNLTGLNQITASSLYIANNQNISDLTALSNLQHVSSLYLLNNPKITDIDFLSNITNSTMGVIVIGGNDNLLNISGLANITTVENTEVLNDPVAIRIENNPLLNSIDGLGSLTETVGGLIISNNNLVSLAGLGNLTKIQGDFEISHNQLTSLNGLNNLTDVRGLFISHTQLQTLDGLENLAAVHGVSDSMDPYGGIYIHDNSQLKDYCSLQNLFSLDDNLNFNCYGNFYNPTENDIKNGDCSI